MIQIYIQFWLFGKELGLVFPPLLWTLFQEKMFLMLYSINWPNFIVWYSLLFKILGNMCIAVFLYEQKLKIIFKHYENKKSFYNEMVFFFIIFQGLSVAKSCLWPAFSRDTSSAYPRHISKLACFATTVSDF